MPDAPQPHDAIRNDAATPAGDAAATRRAPRADADAFPCDRCGAAMFRMHAVWRCPSCGYKTDCCGW